MVCRNLRHTLVVLRYRWSSSAEGLELLHWVFSLRRTGVRSRRKKLVASTQLDTQESTVSHEATVPLAGALFVQLSSV